jgi:hypothetical protein
MTSGSHASRPGVHLGTVHDTPDGPRWEPATSTATDDLITALMSNLARPDADMEVSASTRAHLFALRDTLTTLLGNDPHAELDSSVFGPAY